MHSAEGNRAGPVATEAEPFVLLQRCATASGSSPGVYIQTSAAMQMPPRSACMEIPDTPSLLISMTAYKHEQLYVEHMPLQAFAQVAMAHQLLVAGTHLPAHGNSEAAAASPAATADMGALSLQVTPYSSAPSTFALAWQPSSMVHVPACHHHA